MNDVSNLVDDDDDDKKQDDQSDRNFGSQGNLFPGIATPAGLVRPNEPELDYAKAFLYNAMFGFTVSRDTFRPRTTKQTNTDISTIVRSIRRDCYIPVARQLLRVVRYDPTLTKKHKATLAFFFLSDEQRYHLDLAFPDWINRWKPYVFKGLVGKQTDKYQRSLKGPMIAESGQTKNAYKRFFAHDKDFVLPDTWVEPKDR